MNNKKQQTIETKIWAIDQIVKFSMEIETIKKTMHQKTFGDHDPDYNPCMWDLKIEMLKSQIEQIQIWIVNN